MGNGNPEATKDVATALAGGVTILAAIFAAFGELTGTVARLARNYPVLTAVAVILVVLAVGCALAARLSANSKFLWIGIPMLMAGIIIAVILTPIVFAKDDRPSITAKAIRDDEDRIFIEGTAHASGLRADDRMFVRVTMSTVADPFDRLAYYAIVGPDGDGVMTHEFSMPAVTNALSVIVTVGAKDQSEVCLRPPHLPTIPPSTTSSPTRTPTHTPASSPSPAPNPSPPAAGSCAYLILPIEQAASPTPSPSDS